MPRTQNNNTNNQNKGEGQIPEFLTPFIDSFKSFNSDYEELATVWNDNSFNAFKTEYYIPFADGTKDYISALYNYYDIIQQIAEQSKNLVDDTFAGTNGLSILNLKMVCRRLPRRLMNRFGGGWKG